VQYVVHSGTLVYMRGVPRGVY